MQVRRWELAAAAVWRAVVRPVPLSSFVLGIGLAAAHADWSAACAGGAFVLTTGYELTRPDLWRRALRGVRRRSPELPFDGDFPDPSTRELARRLFVARLERTSVMAQVSAPTRARFDALVEPVAELERKAIEGLGLLRRATDRLRALGELPGAPTPDDEVVEEWRVPRCEAALLSAEQRRADEAGEHQRRATDGMRRTGDLLRARLEILVRTLETLPTVIVQLDIAGHDLGAWHADRDVESAIEALSGLTRGALGLDDVERALGDAERA